jgi:hypothetical protein
VQLSAPQLQVAAQTLYPGYRGAGFNGFYPIPANGGWLFTFSGKPRLKKNEF